MVMMILMTHLIKLSGSNVRSSTQHTADGAWSADAACRWLELLELRLGPSTSLGPLFSVWVGPY